MDKEIIIRGLRSDEEIVDAVVSFSLKERNKKFGVWMRELASIVRTYYTSDLKGKWQGLWAVATRAFSYGYRGYTVERTIESLTPLADEYGLAGVDVDKLITDAWMLGSRYGERRGKPKTPQA